MEFHAYKRLSPKLKNAVMESMGSENIDRFTLKSPGIKVLGNIAAHYVVLDQNEDELLLSDGRKMSKVPRILAYGEAIFLDENNELEVELCVKENNVLVYEMLLSGINKMAKREKIIAVIRSALEEDATLLRSGFRLCGSDHLMQYIGTAVITEKKHKSELGNKGLFIKTEQKDGAVIFSLLSVDKKNCYSSCMVHEYISSVCITDVFTGEEFRGMGFASELIEIITEKYSNESKNIILHVSGENEKAISVYLKLGFSVKESLYTYKTI